MEVLLLDDEAPRAARLAMLLASAGLSVGMFDEVPVKRWRPQKEHVRHQGKKEVARRLAAIKAREGGRVISYLMFLWCIANMMLSIMAERPGYHIVAWAALAYYNAYQVAKEAQ